MTFPTDAACHDRPVALFFPHDGQSGAEAKAICRGCPVRDACLELALTERIVHGIWGGLGERERKRLLSGLPAHGRRAYYKRGCRCFECCEANRVYVAEQRRRSA